MGRALLFLFAIGGCGTDGGSGSPDAHIVEDASVIAKDAAVPVDGPAPDLDQCPNTYVNSGSCPHPGLACYYLEAACFCDNNAGLWFCCEFGKGAKCAPLTTQAPPNTGDGCNEAPSDQPCQWGCVNGKSTSCACSNCRWQCWTTPCAADAGGATDGG